MNEFEVKSYNNLINAEDIIRNTAKDLSTELENCNSNLKSLFDENSFFGPIADHVENALNIINTATTNNINSLNDIANSINKIGNSYIETDNKVSNDVGGI